MALLISRHEPWFDEAQAWLLARDASFGQLITHYLRYEGSPGLWHYLLIAPAKGGLPYASMSWLAGGIASAGALVFILYSPFPLLIRYLTPFSFFLFYQYGAVARSYVLLPLLLFSIAAIYHKTNKRLLLFASLLILLANVSLHGFILAGALALDFAFRTYRSWSELSGSERRRRLTFFGTLLLVAILIVWQLRRPPDLVGFGSLNLSLKHLLAVSALKCRNAFTGLFALSAPLLLVSVWWFYRRKVLPLFALGMADLLALAGVAYSNVWHEGALVLWWIFIMWISWPDKPERIPRPVLACWAVFLAVQIAWSARTSFFDLRSTYSGSEALAKYIHANKLDERTIFAFDPKSTAVLPYFDHEIFTNWPREHSFWFWSNSNKIESTFGDIPKTLPEYVVLAISRDSEPLTVDRRRALLHLGYHLDRRFDGALCWKFSVLEENTYELYQAADPPS